MREGGGGTKEVRRGVRGGVRQGCSQAGGRSGGVLHPGVAAMTESRICHAHRLNSLASVLLLSAAFGLETSGPQGWRWPMKPWFRMGFGRRLMRVVPMTDSGFPAEEVTRVRPRRREGRSPQSMKPCVRKAGPVEPMGETRPWKVVFAYRRSRWIRKPMKGWRRGAAMMLFGMGAQSTSCRLCWPCTPKKHPPVCGTPNACARCQLRRTRVRFSDEGAGFGSGLGQSGLGAHAIRAVDVASATYETMPSCPQRVVLLAPKVT